MEKYQKLTAKTRKKLTAEYGIAVNTLKSRLKKAGIVIPPGLIYPKLSKLYTGSSADLKILIRKL